MVLKHLGLVELCFLFTQIWSKPHAAAGGGFIAIKGFVIDVVTHATTALEHTIALQIRQNDVYSSDGGCFTEVDQMV